jgi:hypothetical protein
MTGPAPSCHDRACPGHPRLCLDRRKKTWVARIKSLLVSRIVLLWSAHQWAGSGRVLGIGATLAQLVAQIALVAVGPFCVGLLVIFTVFNGVAEGLFTIALPLVTVEIWGDDGYATIQGAIQTPSMLARAASPALIAVTWTSMGSYGLAAPVLAFVSVISSAAYLAAAMPRGLRS